jgi:hypothetical protein
MLSVELIYFPGCPNVAEARSHLARAFAEAKLTPRWSEFRTDDPDLPGHARGYGSPTIFVNGRDVTGAAPNDSAEACRLYSDETGRRSGIPSLASIVGALMKVQRAHEPIRPWRRNLALLPGFGFALLPKLACPACWPAYAGILGSLGLGFLIGTRWLLPLTATFLAVAVGVLAYRAPARHGLRPFALGIAAAGLVLAGKFAFDRDPAMYGGLALLVTASIWNTWPVRGPSGASCPACAPSGGIAVTSQGATNMEVSK